MNSEQATDKLVRTIGGVAEGLGAGACFGVPVEREGQTLIPVARLTFRYGMGFGSGRGTATRESEASESEVGRSGGGGGGAYGTSSPVAVIEITRDGVAIRPIVDVTRIALASMMLTAWCSFWLLLTIRGLARRHTPA